MDAQVEAFPYAAQPPVLVAHPAVQTAPLVFASPHSGRCYPAEFLAASRLDPPGLRRSEDSFVDELFAAAPHYGAPLLAADIQRFLARPAESIAPIVAADAPPGAPIGGDSGMGWLARPPYR